MVEFSGANIPPFFNKDELKLALRARKFFRRFRETGALPTTGFMLQIKLVAIPV